jgi:bisphosphoglycerate-dependent phosphoglycerate mutase
MPYINKKIKIVPLLKKGDKVYLLIKNLCIRRLIKKLDKIKVRLFFISK